MGQIRWSVTLFLACLMVSHSVLAYDPPIGIPEPLWGTFSPIDATAPAQPSGWPSSEVVNHYYVDSSHPQSTDSNNTFGYPDKPRNNIPETTYAAGSYVEIHGGPYSGGGQIIFTANGTEAEPVWIVGDAANKPEIVGEMIPKGAYIILENLKFTTNKKTLGLRVHNGSNLHHLAIRNSLFAGPGTADGASAAIGIGGTSGNRFNDFVIYNNEIHSFGDDATSAVENDYHGVIPTDHVDRVWILNNKIYDMGGDSVQVGKGGSQDAVTHIYIGKNEMYGNHENAVDVKESSFVVISENLMYDFETTSTSPGEIVVIHNGPPVPKHVWVINNVLHTGTYGILSAQAEDAWFIGNIIYNIHHTVGSSYTPSSFFSEGAAIHMRNSTGGAVNNTIYDYDTGFQLPTGNEGYTILNNVVMNRAELLANDVAALTDVANLTTLNNNLIYNGANDDRFQWGSGSVDVGLAALQTGKNTCLNCIAGQDPALEKTDTAKLGQFAFNSPVFNAGTDISQILQKFTDAFGLTIDKDLYQNPRTTSTSQDIGAVEYPTPATSPNPPGGVSATTNN